VTDPGRTILVIPCYNEAHRLDRRAFRDALDARPWLALRFVDDGSTDATRDVLEQLGAEHPEVSVSVLPRNLGKAEAVRAGLRAALESRPGFVGYWDADLSTPLDAVDEFRRFLLEHEEIDWVRGSRVRLMGRDIDRRAMRHYFGRGFATCASLALGLPVYDTQCGAKVFRVTDDLSGLLDDPFISGWAFDVELIARLNASSGRDAAMGRIEEIPLRNWRDVPGSKVGLFGGVRALAELPRIRARYGLGRRRPP
jgi:glycosyltransferase involved in cell wall biosynthesis